MKQIIYFLLPNGSKVYKTSTVCDVSIEKRRAKSYSMETDLKVLSSSSIANLKDRFQRTEFATLPLWEGYTIDEIQLKTESVESDVETDFGVVYHVVSGDENIDKYLKSML